MSSEELLAHVLRLPRHERAQIAEELLSSLDETNEDEVARAWVSELDHRSRDVAEGKVQPIEWKAARTELLEELEQRRASRAAS